MVAVAYDVKSWMAGLVVSRAGERRSSAAEPWIDLDRQLRSIAARRSALDHDELVLIRKAIRMLLWRRFGMASMREYLEVAMGYSPQVAAERLRVAEALDALPAIERALGTNELSYSAVRELTRIVTCKTEDAWLDACRGKNLRQIEELVSEREPGDAPTDKPKPDLRPHAVKMLLRPAVRALLRQVRHVIANERGERIDDSELIEELCRAYLAGSGDADSGGVAAGDTASRDAIKPRPSRPPVQIAISRCDVCKQARQHSAGRTIAITEAEYQTAACDAVMIGSLDGAPARASSTIPPATKRQVKQRDNFRCAVPWCRAAANIDVHHILHRENGGGHEPENLTSLCSGHHAAHHRGELLIEGKAPALTFRRRVECPHVGDRDDVTKGPNRLSISNVPHVGDLNMEAGVVVPHVGDHDWSVVQRDALLALTALGFTKREAERALAAAQLQNARSSAPDLGASRRGAPPRRSR